MPGPGLLNLPIRSSKPRRTGITHVLDRGLPLAQATDLLEQNGCYVDVWKFGWGIAYLDPRPAAKRDLRAAAERFIVLAEVGSKHADVRLTPEQWALAAARDLDASATWILAEGRASGTVGIYSSSGAVRPGVIEALAAVVSPDWVVFEAPREDQQAWFVRRFGPDANLANVPPDGALGLETFRLSLRADAYGAWTPGLVPVRGT
jgi:phosphosulfolactate synthase